MVKLLLDLATKLKAQFMCHELAARQCEITRVFARRRYVISSTKEIILGVFARLKGIRFCEIENWESGEIVNSLLDWNTRAFETLGQVSRVEKLA